MLDRWQQQCQLISTACGLRGGADVIGVQRAQTGAANCWPLREKGKKGRAWEIGHVRAGAVAFFLSRRSSRHESPGEGSSMARGGTMRRGEDVGGEVVMTRGWSVLHVACWSQGLRSESPRWQRQRQWQQREGGWRTARSRARHSSAEEEDDDGGNDDGEETKRYGAMRAVS